MKLTLVLLSCYLIISSMFMKKGFLIVLRRNFRTVFTGNNTALAVIFKRVRDAHTAL
jgi:hypothetical protein